MRQLDRIQSMQTLNMQSLFCLCNVSWGGMISLWQGRPRTNIIECFFLLQSVLLASPQLFSFHPPFSQHPLSRALMDQCAVCFQTEQNSWHTILTRAFQPIWNGSNIFFCCCEFLLLFKTSLVWFGITKECKWFKCTSVLSKSVFSDSISIFVGI